MFDHVIVGVDGQHGGRDAIALASDLVARGGRLTLAHINRGFPVAAKGDPPEFASAERERSLEILKTARLETGVDAEIKALGWPTVSGGLHILAERCEADLLVIGSGRSMTGRVLPGASPKATLTDAPCAVAVAPRGYAESTRTVSRIGVAFDSSLGSLRALAAARLLSERFAAKLSAWHAVELPASRFVSPVKVARDLFESISVELEPMHDAELHELYGEPAEALAQCSDDVDLLVMGCSDRGPIGRLICGSTSRKLAGICRCPLLVIGCGGRASDASECAPATPAANRLRPTPVIHASREQRPMIVPPIEVNNDRG